MIIIISCIILFGLLVAIHEAGHFLTAKLLGVQVNEFAVGMGPAILKKKVGETQYSLRAFPVGGYCAMEGEDGENTPEGETPPPPNPRAFCRKAPWKRIIILSAGSAANLIAGFLLAVILFSVGTGYAVPVIRDFMPGFPLAGEEGLMPGDRILSINGHKVSVYGDVQMQLAAAAKKETLDLVLERNGETITRQDFPMTQRDYVQDGKTLHVYGLYFDTEAPTPLGVLKQSWGTCGYFARSVWTSLGMMVRGEVGIRDLSGPVGIVSFVDETAKESQNLSAGMQNMVYFMSLVAVNLAVMNMLPIPALDGGRIFLLLVSELYRKIAHRDPDPKYEAALHGMGFVLLILLMVVVTFSDVFKILK